ncbi:hypothetical protein BCR36DRAFT_587962 [Piromyces finnis]|uniref:Coth-domain-containing protein n=1 Tax=Piromyces finnis TaxID=1754191 RepID=A0A1Y1UU20_9FUNG|nr:hypothetical protein BCR36DRAFT_587962 [Piromyces finnis]|eukprot:ORX41521.1 hypothetical protein BCR36DRAFT_587962 [Piromyces finnis]
MKINTINLALASMVALTNAATWKFNVVNISGSEYDMGLKYNNQIVKMTSEIYPLYTTTIESGASNTYKYVLLDKSGNVVEEEYFERTYTDAISNINEVYERVTKNVNISGIPKVFDPLYNSGTEKYQEFPKNEIYTIYAKCDDEAYTDLKYHPFTGSHKNENYSNCTINFITPTSSESKTGALYLVGYNSRTFKKLSWKFKLDKKILGRKTIKVRALASDPTLMRDKLASELYRAVGVPVYSGTYARVIINDDVWGLYSIVDTIGGKWIANMIHGNEDAHVGYSYKMYSSVPNGPYASLRYLGEDPNKYLNSGSYEVDEIDKMDTEAPNTFYRLARFTKMFENWVNDYEDDQSNEAVEALESFFDLESLLRQMTIEALTVAYDNFWAQLGNYALYFNPETNRYQIIPYDFDGSFYGSNGSDYYASNYLSDCIGWADNTLPDKYFVNNLFKHDIIKTRYQRILAATVNNVFNTESLSPFIDSVSQLIRDDVEWNFNLIDDLDPNIPGYVNHFTLENFDDNTNFKFVGYNAAVSYNDAHYGIKQWVQTRGGYCKAYAEKALGSAAEAEPITTVQKKTTSVVAPTTTSVIINNVPTITKVTTTTVPVVTTSPVIVVKTTPSVVKTTTTKKSTTTKSQTATTRARVTKKVTVKKVVTVTKYVVKN